MLWAAGVWGKAENVRRRTRHFKKEKETFLSGKAVIWENGRHYEQFSITN